MVNRSTHQVEASIRLTTATGTLQKGMLLVLPVPLRSVDGRLLFEEQACSGLEQWADNFGFVTVATLLMPEALAAQQTNIVWRDVATLASPQRFEFVPLPWAYSFALFWTHYRSTQALLEQLVKRSRYLQFCLGGLVGDWAAVAAIVAHSQNRPYAIHTDWVEHKHVLQMSKEAGLSKRLKTRIFSLMIEKYNTWIIQRSALGLWHGADCYSAYSPLCQNSFLIHDIHTKAQDVITSAELRKKVETVLSGEPIRICYAGRMEPMKAPLDWIKAVERAHQLGVNLTATWLGAGSLLGDMQRMIAERDLGSVIELAGFESDRDRVLKKIRASHLMLFTHITSESPRCLIEALLSGTAIVGYQSHYAEDLVKERGGGEFVPVNQWEGLGALIAALASDRPRLAQLVQQAGENGKRFNAEVVFRERSDLLKAYLA